MSHRTFYGQCYWYNTPNHGRRRIGVANGQPPWVVAGWINDIGELVRVSTPHLPKLLCPVSLQARLDTFAASRHLEKA